MQAIIFNILQAPVQVERSVYFEYDNLMCTISLEDCNCLLTNVLSWPLPLMGCHLNWQAMYGPILCVNILVNEQQLEDCENGAQELLYPSDMGWSEPYWPANLHVLGRATKIEVFFLNIHIPTFFHHGTQGDICTWGPQITPNRTLAKWSDLQQGGFIMCTQNMPQNYRQSFLGSLV